MVWFCYDITSIRDGEKKVGKIEMVHGWRSGEEESGKWEGGSAKETESENVKKTVGEKPLKESLWNVNGDRSGGRESSTFAMPLPSKVLRWSERLHWMWMIFELNVRVFANFFQFSLWVERALFQRFHASALTKKWGDEDSACIIDFVLLKNIVKWTACRYGMHVLYSYLLNCLFQEKSR